MVKNSRELLKSAGSEGPRRIAVAAANDAQTLTACLEAGKRGIADPILVGYEQWIVLILEKMGADPGELEILLEADPVKAAEEAVKIVRTGGAQALMKGNLSTSKFLHTALSASEGFRTGRLLSDVEVYEDVRRADSSSSWSVMGASTSARTSTGSLEMEALAEGAFRVLTGQETPLNY